MVALNGWTDRPATEEQGMLTLPCPWCDELALLALAEIRDPLTPFTCQSCGTSVAIADEPAAVPDLPVWVVDPAA